MEKRLEGLIELDITDLTLSHDPMPGETPAASRFADWLRSNGWAVSTEHSGPMRIGGRTADEDESVRNLQLLLLEEFSVSAVIC